MRVDCSYCYGMGSTYHWTYDPGYGGDEWDQPCEHCNATGKVKVGVIDYIQIKIFEFKIYLMSLTKKKSNDEVTEEDMPF